MVDRTVKQVLIDARKWIEREEDWFGGGKPCRGDQLCAMLAIYKGESTNRLADAAYAALSAAVGNRIVPWNDTHTHAEVLAGFDKAIEAQD